MAITTRAPVTSAALAATSIRSNALARQQPPRPTVEPTADPGGVMPPAAIRRVAAKGTISFAAAHYKVGEWLAGQNVEVVCEGGLVQIHHRCVLIATHARRHHPGKQSAGMTRGVRGKEPQARPTVSVVTMTRKVDSSGNVCFTGACYRAGNKFRRRQVQVAIVGDHLEISIGEQLIRRHKIKHDRTREHGALANPGGRPRRINAA